MVSLAFRKLLSAALLLIQVLHAEESSILDGVTICGSEERDLKLTYTTHGGCALIDGNFKTYYTTDSSDPRGDGSKELTIELPEETKIVSAFVLARSDTEAWHKQFGSV